MTGHIHAALMLQYAQDAQETDKPWERWEFLPPMGVWGGFHDHPIWYKNTQYRRKPKIMLINGIEVPEPLKVMPSLRDSYYVVDFAEADHVYNYQWRNDYVDHKNFNLGLCHSTKEAAEAHAKALLSFTYNQP